MQHSFDIKIAKEYGVNAAILLNNIYFWIEKNRANNNNFYDDFYWTYSSKKAFADLFPYMNERQIDYALKKLIDDNVLITGNYNKLAYDRTLWYAITKKGYSILQNCEMEKQILSNENNNIVQPIPNITKNKTTDIKNNKKESKKETTYDSIIDEFTNDPNLKNTIIEFIKMRKLIKKPLTDNALKLMLDKLKGFTSNINEQIEILNNSVINSWQGIFPLKNNSYNNYQAPQQNNEPVNKIAGVTYL